MVVAKPSPAHAGRSFEAISLGHVSGLVQCSREPSGVRQGDAFELTMLPVKSELCRSPPRLS